MRRRAVGEPDELDLEILSHLKDDGRRSFTDIAESLGVSVGTVSNRLSKMLEDEVVRIVPRVDPYRVGFRAPATILISVEPHRLEAAIEEIKSFPEISWLGSIAGDHDLVADVMCRDTSHLRSFLFQRLANVSGVTRTATSLYLKVHKIALPDFRLVSPDRIPQEQEISWYS